MKYCTYPKCKCTVSTSTSQPEPECPKGLAHMPVQSNATTAIDELGKVRAQLAELTCENCGSRQTMETPNTFYATGICEECKHVTNIEQRGCNYVVHASGEAAIAVQREMARRK